MIDSTRVQNAKGLYLEGIRDGNVREALEKYTGDRYTQHSAGVRDGKEGFIAFFTQFVRRNPVRDIRIHRAFEDGNFVFVHAYQSLNNGEAEWVTADIFDTDNKGRMIEHWDVIAAYEGPNPSGRTMVDGLTDIEDLEKTTANKAIVRAFVEEVLIGGKIDRAADFVSTVQFARHNPEVSDGLQSFADELRQGHQGGRPAKYIKAHKLLGQGNFVVVFSEVRKEDSDWAVFDLFRVEDDKIVEHWDVQEKIGPQETWMNSGKF